jgi:hypothetical protein
LAVLGIVPQGVPLGELLGLLGAFGLVVDGSVPGWVVPGVVVFGDPFGEVDPGLFWRPACGVAVPAGGVAGEAVVELCPALCPAPCPADGAEPPAGALCAAAHVVHTNAIDNNVILLAIISEPPFTSILLGLSLS